MVNISSFKKYICKRRHISLYVTNRLRIKENIAILILFIFSSDTVRLVVPKLYSASFEAPQVIQKFSMNFLIYHVAITSNHHNVILRLKLVQCEVLE